MASLQQAQYVNEAFEKQYGFAAAVQSGNMLSLSGIVAVDDNVRIVAPGDMGGQIDRIYDIMESILGLHQATLEHVVNEFLFVIDMAALGEAAPRRLRRYAGVGRAYPATTAVQVAGLFVPEAMIEIQATAMLDG